MTSFCSSRMHLKAPTGVSAIMIARAAEANMSAFRAEGLLDPVSDVVPRYIRIVRTIMTACDWLDRFRTAQAHAIQNPYANSKYCINSMDYSKRPLREPQAAKRRKQLKAATGQAKDYKQLAQVYDVTLTEDPELWLDLLPELQKRRAGAY